MNQRAPADLATVLIVADDLIWSSRLREAVERAGARPSVVAWNSLEESHGDLVVVDLGGRTYDGVAAVRDASQAAHVIIAVGQHEDLELRKRALAAGAQRVYSYNKLFTDGPQVIAGWLNRDTPTSSEDDD